MGVCGVERFMDMECIKNVSVIVELFTLYDRGKKFWIRWLSYCEI